MGGALLFVLAAYVVVSAAYGLWLREGQQFSAPGLDLAVLAIPVMWWLARAKMRIADQIGSHALQADAVESITCGYLSGVVLIGLTAQFLVPGWWWIDSVTSSQSLCCSSKRAARLGRAKNPKWQSRSARSPREPLSLVLDHDLPPGGRSFSAKRGYAIRSVIRMMATTPPSLYACSFVSLLQVQQKFFFAVNTLPS